MAQYTISQALRRIAKLKGQLNEWQRRATAAATVEVGKEPEFTFEASVARVNALQTELLGLSEGVAVANAKTTIDTYGRTITLAGATRVLQELKGQIAFYQGLNLMNRKDETVEWDVDPADFSKRTPRRVVTEFKAAMTERARDEKVQSLQDHFEALNNAVETANHTTKFTV